MPDLSTRSWRTRLWVSASRLGPARGWGCDPVTLTRHFAVFCRSERKLGVGIGSTSGSGRRGHLVGRESVPGLPAKVVAGLGGPCDDGSAQRTALGNGRRPWAVAGWGSVTGTLRVPIGLAGNGRAVRRSHRRGRRRFFEAR